ncbi:MAG: hypothetical protein M0P01_04325 [Treponema sp.]|nr:hypothetical protein [Treponema sp.]
MKKILVPVVVFALLCGFMHAQSEVTQVTLPKRIFIGDTAEVRYTFRSSVNFFSDMNNSKTLREIDSKSLGFDLETDDYTVTKASLARSGSLYTFSLCFIPWRTGDINFPSFDLARAVYGTASFTFSIDMQPVSVSSILQAADDRTLRPPAGPQLLPGTVYALYAAAVAILFLLVVLIRIIVKWPVICKARKEKKILRSYARNERELLRRLRRLGKAGTQISDIQFCSDLQQLIRRYLDFRYGYHFSTVITSQFMAAFDKVTAGTLSDKKQKAVEELVSVLSRTDYIRFAHDSIDSNRLPAEQYSTELSEVEREQLLERIRGAVDSFEEVQ